jgi:hypothetical protein
MRFLHALHLARISPRGAVRVAFGLLVLASTLFTGCAAITSPVADGIPVSLLPPELLGKSKNNLKHLPLSLLNQPSPGVYLLGPRDVLGVWIEGVVGDAAQPIPVIGQLPIASVVVNSQLIEKDKLAAGPGIPVTVGSDGTIALPYVAPIVVAGLTVDQAREAIRHAFTVRTRRARGTSLTFRQRKTIWLTRWPQPAACPEWMPVTKSSSNAPRWRRSTTRM